MNVSIGTSLGKTGTLESLEETQENFVIAIFFTKTRTQVYRCAYLEYSDSTAQKTSEDVIRSTYTFAKDTSPMTSASFDCKVDLMRRVTAATLHKHEESCIYISETFSNGELVGAIHKLADEVLVKQDVLDAFEPTNPSQISFNQAVFRVLEKCRDDSRLGLYYAKFVESLSDLNKNDSLGESMDYLDELMKVMVSCVTTSSFESDRMNKLCDELASSVSNGQLIKQTTLKAVTSLLEGSAPPQVVKDFSNRVAAKLIGAIEKILSLPEPDLISKQFLSSLAKRLPHVGSAFSDQLTVIHISLAGMITG